MENNIKAKWNRIYRNGWKDLLINPILFSKTETPSKTMSKNEISDWKNQFCKIFSRSDEKIFKFFLTVNQVLTKKIRKKLEKNLVSSENGCIFASEIKTKKKPKN